MTNIDHAIHHFYTMQEDLDMSTVWSIYEVGLKDADYVILDDNKPRKITYTTVRNDATADEIMNDVKNGTNETSIQVSSLAVNGSIKELWRAAESCIKQSGTHHRYIEDFKICEDGSLELTTGS